jgi:hypothetical protein
MTNQHNVSKVFISTTCSLHFALKPEKKDSSTGLSPGAAGGEEPAKALLFSMAVT